jgi:hypothetical protein
LLIAACLVVLGGGACGPEPVAQPAGPAATSPEVAPTPAAYERSTLAGRLTLMADAIRAIRGSGDTVVFRDSSARGHFIRLAGPQLPGQDDVDLEMPASGYLMDPEARAVIYQSGLRQPDAQHATLWRDDIEMEDHEIANICEQIFRRVFKSPGEYSVVVERA